MSSISITVDGVVRTIEADQRPTHIFSEAKEIVVCKVNGVLKDLWTELAEGDVVEGVAISSPEGLSVLRHSTAHVMDQAVQQVVSITTSILKALSPQRILRRLKAQCARL